jgi:hypothetical protein
LAAAYSRNYFNQRLCFVEVFPKYTLDDMKRVYTDLEITRPIARALGVESDPDRYTVTTRLQDDFQIVAVNAANHTRYAEFAANSRKCYLQETNRTRSLRTTQLGI